MFQDVAKPLIFLLFLLFYRVVNQIISQTSQDLYSAGIF